MHVFRPIALVIVLLVGAAAGMHAGVPTPSVQADPAPAINDTIVATFIRGAVTLNGSNFGSAGAGRSIEIIESVGGETHALQSTDPLVSQWTATKIAFGLPAEADTGTVKVIVDSQPSNTAKLRVYGYAITGLPAGGVPLSIAVSPQDGRVWVNNEFHTQLGAATAALPSVASALTVPQAADSGIFATQLFGLDARTQLSSAGEDIDVQVVEGVERVWFTEGGWLIYPPAGVQYNSSRIISYTPSTSQFACYNVPVDNAGVNGLLVDESRGTLWYTESNLFADGSQFVGNAITGFSIDDAVSDCDWDPNPPSNDPRPLICGQPAVEPCHKRIVLPQTPATSGFGSWPAHVVLDPRDGNIWFTEFWKNELTSGAAATNRIGRLNPDTGEIIQLVLPTTIARNGPGISVGSGPWELEFDDTGDLWIVEFFDATIMKVDLSNPTCLANPAASCISQVYANQNGYEDKNIHTISTGNDGFMYFGLSTFTHGISQFGLVSTADGDAVALLPPLPAGPTIAGVQQDRATGDIWFALFEDRQLGRLRLNDDMDAVADASDNCAAAYNPTQSNNDGDGLGDACDPDDDNDGMPDWYELGSASFSGVRCLNEFVVDPSVNSDGDTLTALVEFQQNTNACWADSDFDGYKDTPWTSHTPGNTNTAFDNCPAAANANQLNSDANFIELTDPPASKPTDDTSWINSDAKGDECDTDDDNDGRLDADEITGYGCVFGMVTTNPLLRDSDGDRFLDMAECNLSSNPSLSTSTPANPAPGTDPDNDKLSTLIEWFIGTLPNVADTDGDGLNDGVEFRSYNSNPLVTNTDGDACGDAREVASVNNLAVVDVVDRNLVAAEFGSAYPVGSYKVHFDTNKDGVVNTGDIAFVTAKYGACP